MLIDKIREAQSGSQQHMLEIIEKFRPLLRRYARLLNYEDAINDVTVEFIALLTQMNISIFANKGDGAVVCYINQAVIHSYVMLSKRHSALYANEILIDDLSDERRYHIEGQTAQSDADLFDFLALFPEGALTCGEQNVLVQKYYFGYSSAEIAKRLGTSRQSVNQTKARALKKLRKKII